ncbi:MAG: NAD(P)H-dependent flavin oxidoreductase [Actinomycetota bacterium]
MLRTWLTDRFGLRLPLVAAPMGGTADGRFAATVSANGALGMVAAGTRATADFVRREAAVASNGGHQFGIGLLAWVLDRRPELLEAAFEARPALLSISYGDYRPYLDVSRKQMIAVTTQVGTVEEARRAQDAGLDFVVARGGEGGGHGRNEVATLPLLQEVLDAVEVPVLAAGGVATARGLAAVLAAGAAGAWVGTAFLGCVETSWSEEARRRVIEAGDGATIYTRSFDVGLRLDWPPLYGGRALHNTFSDRWHGHEDDLSADDRAAAEMAHAVSNQDFDRAPVWAGQAVSMIERRRTVAAVLGDFARAEDLLRRW